MIRRKRNGRVAMMASFLLALSLSSPPLSADAEQQHAVEVAEAALTEISDVFRYAAVELRESMLHFDAGTESELPTAEYKLTQRFPHFKYERAEKEWCQTTSYDGKVYRILGSQVDDAGALPVLTIADRVPDYFFLARGFSFYGVPVRGISDDGPTRDWRT